MIMTTGYLGPEGTNSETAAKKLCGGSDIIPYPSFAALFSALEKGEAEQIVIPVENTLNGAVVQNLDLMQETEGVYAAATTAIKIDHRLLTLKGADKKGIKRVYSHPQALGQCEKYILRELHGARLCNAPSTAAGAEYIKSAEDAAIVTAGFEREGFELSGENISDNKDNYTYFFKVVKGVPRPDPTQRRVFFSVTCRHEAGSLVNLLTVLSDHGINMTEIESRPIKDRRGEFRFFIEIEGSLADRNTASALEELGRRASTIKLLGAY